MFRTQKEHVLENFNVITDFFRGQVEFFTGFNTHRSVHNQLVSVFTVKTNTYRLKSSEYYYLIAKVMRTAFKLFKQIYTNKYEITKINRIYTIRENNTCRFSGKHHSVYKRTIFKQPSILSHYSIESLSNRVIIVYSRSAVMEICPVRLVVLCRSRVRIYLNKRINTKHVFWD